jgi:hypothetical protein
MMTALTVLFWLVSAFNLLGFIALVMLAFLTIAIVKDLFFRKDTTE